MGRLVTECLHVCLDMSAMQPVLLGTDNINILAHGSDNIGQNAMKLVVHIILLLMLLLLTTIYSRGLV